VDLVADMLAQGATAEEILEGYPTVAVVSFNHSGINRFPMSPRLLAKSMLSVLCPFLVTLSSVFRSRTALQVEILALRHQIGVLRRSAKKRLKLTVVDLVFWAWLSGVWADLAIRSGYRQTGDRHRPAPRRLPFVLDLEGSARKIRKAHGLAGSPGSDPYHESCQPNLGCAAHPWRAT
jgi:hypothetical protein